MASLRWNAQQSIYLNESSRSRLHLEVYTHTECTFLEVCNSIDVFVCVCVVVGVGCGGQWIYRSMRLDSLSCSLSGGNALCRGGNSRLAPTQGGKVRHLILMSRSLCWTQGCLKDFSSNHVHLLQPSTSSHPLVCLMGHF